MIKSLRKIKLISLVLLLLSICLVSLKPIYAQSPTPSPSKKTKDPMFHLPSDAAPSEPSKKPLLPILPKSLDSLVNDTAKLFVLPGIVGLKNGDWVGSDDLLNLSNNIEVDVEIVLGSGKTFPFTEEQVKSQVTGLLIAAGINIHAETLNNDPPLPLLHVLIFTNSVGDPAIYGTFCAVRLFEAVQLKRLVLGDGTTYQAITWEKQDLLLSTGKELEKETKDLLKDQLTAFIDRFKYYRNLKNQINQ